MHFGFSSRFRIYLLNSVLGSWSYFVSCLSTQNNLGKKKKKVFGNFILLALENNDTFGVNKWSLNLITHHYKCITHSPAFLMTTSQFNAKLDKKYYPEKKGRTKGKIPHIFLIDQKILQILHFGTQLLGELQSFLL